MFNNIIFSSSVVSLSDSIAVSFKFIFSSSINSSTSYILSDPNPTLLLQLLVLLFHLHWCHYIFHLLHFQQETSQSQISLFRVVIMVNSSSFGTICHLKKPLISGTLLKIFHNVSSAAAVLFPFCFFVFFLFFHPFGLSRFFGFLSRGNQLL